MCVQVQKFNQLQGASPLDPTEGFAPSHPLVLPKQSKSFLRICPVDTANIEAMLKICKYVIK